MSYKEILPHLSLSDYIDAYWTSGGKAGERASKKILPDGCIDIIFNLGDDCITDFGNFRMKSEQAYLVGTMTRFKEVVMQGEASFLGIRFKPGAFSSFYKFAPLQEITDQTIELDTGFIPDIRKTIRYGDDYLNRFFTDKLKRPNRFLLGVIETIRHCKGRIKVNALAQKHCTTPRQLERNFMQHLGTSPKAFINLVRFQNTLPMVRQRRPGQSLLDIAYKCGYYDHAHLSNAFRHYMRTSPSLL